MRRTSRAAADSPSIWKRSSGIPILILGFLLLSSCARMNYFPPGHTETGLASWYGPEFHGKNTSSKEIYDMYDMTAAHRTLPFGAYVMVTNMNNGKSVIVRINDRGPFVGNRVIDLSYAAARVLDMIGPGTVPVKIEVLDYVSPSYVVVKYAVQVGAFISRDNAESLKNELQLKFENVEISRFETPNQIYYRVRIKAQDRDSAQRIAQILVETGYTPLLLEEQ